MLRSLLSAAVLATALLAAACGPPKPSAADSGSCTGRLPGDLVITELLVNPTGEDLGKEYLEIFNASNEPITLSGMTLRYARVDGSGEKKALLKSGTLQAGAYYVVGDVRDGAALPGYMDDTYGDALGALGNTDGALSILCGGLVIDEVKYTKVKEGAARVLDGNLFPDAIVNDDENRWCFAAETTGDFLGSPRAKNANCEQATCTGRSPGDLVITEFMADPPGTDEGNEYIELYNASGVTIGVGGLTLKYSRLDGTSATQVVLGEGSVAAGKYFTVGDVRSATLPAHIDLSYGAGLGALGNTNGILTVSCGATTVDTVSYTRVTAGAARQLSSAAPPSAAANDDETNWCDAKVTVGAIKGSPGAANESCAGGADAGCVDPSTGLSRAPIPPAPDRLIFSEVMANPAGSDTVQEWIELYALDAVDLNGVTISRQSATASSSTTISSEFCISLPAQTHAVLAKALTPGDNGGIASPVAIMSSSFSLTDGAQLVLTHGGTVIDRANYPPTSGAQSAELTADRMEAWVNDSEYAFCEGITTYGAGGKGTPGQPNRTCPLPAAPGECRDVDAVTDAGIVRNIVRPDAGTLVFTEVMAAPIPPASGTDVPKEWFELVALDKVDLNEVEVANELGSKLTIKQAACFVADPGAHLLFAQTTNASQNGGLPPPRLVFPFELANLATTANPERAVIVRSQGVELDRFAWTTSTVGASMQLTSTVAASPSANELDAGYRCDAPEDAGYGDGGVQDRGTPGAPNVECPP